MKSRNRVGSSLLALSLLLIVSSPSRAQSLRDIDALRYFESRHAGSKINPNWPSRLTFVPILMSPEEASEQVTGIWKVVFTCDGRPLEAALFKETPLVDGTQNLGVFLNFAGKDSYRMLLPSHFELMDLGQVDSFALRSSGLESRFKEHRGQHNISQLGSELRFDFSVDAPPLITQPARIQETGEFVLLARDTASDRYQDQICRKGEMLRGVLLKVPLS